jgi:hypothetical protein
MMLEEPDSNQESGNETNHHFPPAEEEGENRNKRSKSSPNDTRNHSRLLESHIKIALSLYKVQQNIYLLDFQRIEVSFCDVSDEFSYFWFCFL